MHPNKSTTVRSYSRPSVGWAWPALRVASEVEARAADVAAWVSESLMFRTTRRPAPSAEQALLATGRRFRAPSAFGALAGWRWGEGPIVLLVHGWNGRGAQLGGLVAPLVARGFEVVTFDGPGHGASPGARSSLLEMASAIEAVVDVIRPVGASLHGVVAHSMGAAATVVAAHRARSASERAAREGGLFRRFAFVAPPIDVREFMRVFSEHAGLGAPVVEALRRRVETRFATRLEDLYAPQLARDLAAPLLVVHDALDKEVPLTTSERLVAAWPGARLEVTEGLGHARILRDAAVLERLATFVAG